ncbi:serine/threonine protein kinase [Gordonia westfalica]|uniref:non-specific serine/threonine protein kinase n=2 Tax=Gordonia westfalica TaxID=158898 RepID=A0A1H2JGE8_9ACTN|nr:serine/threonine-protein kinase [Gordonia westfalica]SDU55201.1 serine/threonine protein kinase [Gordonia westfalica]
MLLVMSGSRVGTQFGPYRLDALLGRGGMGEVYRAHDTTKERTVALKLLNPGLAGDTMYQERFRRESHAAARLGEPHVIPIHDWGEIDGVLFIDMRLVDGQDLRALLSRETRIDPARAVSIIEQVAAALDAAHAEGLTHRDIKPENILVDANDFAYLVDFGIAHGADDTHLTQTGTAVGSIAYMAPELFDAASPGPASDIYGLACVLFECLTGQVPHPAKTVSAAIRAAVLTPPPAPSSVNADIPEAMDAVIRRGLAAEPAERYGSARELARAARAALSGVSLHKASPDPATSIIKAPHTVIAPVEPAYEPTLIRQTTGPENAPGTRQLSGPQTFGESQQIPAAPHYSGSQHFSGPQQFPGAYGPPPGYPPVHQQPAPRRSVAIPILLGLIAVVLVGIAVVVGVLLAGSGGDSSEQAADPTTPTVTETVAPPTVDNAPEGPGAPASPPPGSAPCDGTVGVGTSVTSCPFAFAVRDAYFRAGQERSPRVVTAASPVTGQSYAMSCVPEGAIVACRGGNDAVVHIY